MAKPEPGAKIEHIEVVLEQVDPLIFRLRSKLIKHGMLRFRNNKHPGFDVHFDLDDQANSGYRFPTSPASAFASKTISDSCAACPPAGQTWAEFEAYEVANGGMTLKAYNENSSRTAFAFTLFLEQAGHDTLELDPIGEDQNGPRR